VNGPEQFISEVIKPVADTCDTSRMAAGEPGLPREFGWRGRTVRVAELLRVWRDTGPCHHGSGEMYVRKHWFEIRTPEGEIMKLYFQRQPPRGGKPATGRWRLYSVIGPEPDALES
jgi:hypothetical protein